MKSESICVWTVDFFFHWDWHRCTLLTTNGLHQVYRCGQQYVAYNKMVKIGLENTINWIGCTNCIHVCTNRYTGTHSLMTFQTKCLSICWEKFDSFLSIYLSSRNTEIHHFCAVLCCLISLIVAPHLSISFAPLFLWSLIPCIVDSVDSYTVLKIHWTEQIFIISL